MILAVSPGAAESAKSKSSSSSARPHSTQHASTQLMVVPILPSIDQVD